MALKKSDTMEKQIIDKEIVIINGVKTILKAADLDGDGKVDGYEYLQQDDNKVTQQTTPSELGDTLKELNRDDIDPVTHMSGIDTRAILHPADIQNIAAFDSLVWLDFLSPKCLAITRKMLRLSVSSSGKGREHMVDVATGKRTFDAMRGDTGNMARIKNFFGGGNDGTVNDRK